MNLSYLSTDNTSDIISILGPAGHIALNAVSLIELPVLLLDLVLIPAVILDKNTLLANCIIFVSSLGGSVTIMGVFTIYYVPHIRS